MLSLLFRRFRSRFVLFLLCLIFTVTTAGDPEKLNYSKTKVWGPGLKAAIVLPARYFFIHAIAENGKKYILIINSFINSKARLFAGRYSTSLPGNYEVQLLVGGGGATPPQQCRATINQINRQDGSVIVRYKVLAECRNAELHIRYRGRHIARSPYRMAANLLPDMCSCPLDLDRWLLVNECPLQERQITEDLIPFRAVNFTNVRAKIKQKHNQPGSVSLCNYVIVNNEIFRECFGQYTGFSMFMDAILTALVRRVRLPDTEFYVNLGDWPLVKKGGQSRTTGPYPIFSWCGSDDSFDIVLPTYDITESTLENMGRVMLDMLSVQHVADDGRKLWPKKKARAFWRGRDSRRERLNLMDLAKTRPELFNVSLTNFFFFRDEEAAYGPKSAHISFMDFFDVYAKY